MNSWWLTFVVSVTTLCFAWSHVAGSKVISIRGIHPSKIPLYSPDRDFHCLDGSSIISFTKVNDDYCDCADGSDEPGTPACKNGSFFCQNLSFKSKYIPSGWVNDGVCDCCDASDEYESNKCVNNCHDLGREAKREADEAQKVAREGREIRNEMVAKGKQIRNEDQQRLSKLRTDYEEAELIKKEKENLKKEIEEKERIALEKYKPPEPVKSETENEEQKENEAEEYFKLLDQDASGTVTVIEIQSQITFDKDKDGVVSEEEALYFLNNQEELTMHEFVESAWANVKPFIMLQQGLFKPGIGEVEEIKSETPEETQYSENNAAHENPDDHEEHDDHDDHEDHEDQEDQENEGEEEGEIERAAEPEEPAPPQYDEETQALVEEANNARQQFQEADKSVNELMSDIKKVEEKLAINFGDDGEFAVLDDQCFDFTDLEYVYTLCMFGKATQRSKSGGSEVNLGSWNDWIGPADNKYSKMKYDHGLTCWNGPARSTVVSLICGTENKLLSVTEPSRCEYAMEFSTPAVCKLLPEVVDTHDEL